MFPLKRFVQGPSLHDEVLFESRVPKTSLGTLKGDEASKAYEEIINLPSTSDEVVCLSTSPPSTSRNDVSPSKRKNPKMSFPIPKLSKLMTFCESNDIRNLEKNLTHFEDSIDINCSDEYGWTLLMCASCAGATECVKLLLQNGASWETVDKKGMTALSIATKNQRSSVRSLLLEWERCFAEYKLRMETRRDKGIETLDETVEVSEKYCQSCEINYQSSQEIHENSIAHLVSTTNFGNDKVHYGIPESNKGFQLMVRSGWNKNSGLGPEGIGHKFPVKTVLKRNKLGLGNDKEKKAARITHFAPFDPAAVEIPVERLERETTVRRREAVKLRDKERRKEINFRREFASL